MSSPKHQNGDATKLPTSTENTPLLPKQDNTTTTTPSTTKTSWFLPIYRVLLCGFLVSLSFGVTQVPLVYVFRLMTCEAYFESHPGHAPSSGVSDRCSLPEIEAGTARAVSLLGCSTTFFGVANLFITGQGIKKFGVKAALALQVFWPAARLAVQNYGVWAGGSNGIIIVQCSQIMTIVGGPVGYMLALNTYVAKVTGSEERTGYLGRLQGFNMFGSSIGFLAGGILADTFSIITPFQVTLVLFCLATIYVLLVLPYCPPDDEAQQASEKDHSLLLKAFGPLKTILPQSWILQDGRVQRQYGALILAAGVFLAVLATGYIPVLLQMYAMSSFAFTSLENSYLTSMHLLLRGLFLVFLFPNIIKYGRRFMENKAKANQATSPPTASDNLEATNQGRLTGAMQAGDLDAEEVVPDTPPKEQTYDFDLIFVRISLLIDGLLTLGATFVASGWQMFLVAALLPFGAGTASAAKGVILQMSTPKDRTDALSAISLVEMLARLMTTFVFGLIFAAFANVEKTYLVFVVNASVAILGAAILVFSRFPPEGSERLEDGKMVEEESEENN